MDKEIQFLIKFGERQYAERFASGYLYFSYAKKFREFEDKLLIKGQGDRLEGSSKFFAMQAEMQTEEGMPIATVDKLDLTLRYGPADNIPVFCLFSCFKKDCEYLEKGEVKIILSDVIKNEIRAHFEKADTAVIIQNPLQFINDIKTAFKECIAEKVNYFNIEGHLMEDGSYAEDLDYFKYLTQDVVPVVTKKAQNGKVVTATRYSFNADFVYRSLLCKDTFFCNEQEFRILLSKENITKPQEYFVKFDSNVQIVDIHELFSNAFTLSV